jgi:hypothetical protein
MKNTIRITLTALVLSLVSACADKHEQPPVKATDGKTTVTPRR